MKLFEVIAKLETLDDEWCIVAKRPWSADAEAELVELTEDYRIPSAALSAGYEYFLEVSVALDAVLDGLGARLTSEQRVEAVIFYAENDAYPEWLYALRQEAAE
ncbi:hypothetical protein GCM10028796_28920 [Ramlibacter monticola]|uniref:DUF7716 domain-containing protein n=1 Tax=Ramlibacter monticola TaxID=1926872 RepID=A0A936Z2U7_9BURK|nr:hypothetical protein [Ramlibacter monticola]MBL0393939.1 hypothetical protein [Ramlibacter monticola]